jgi:hypothetical protein
LPLPFSERQPIAGRKAVLLVLDIAFFVLHAALILFNMFGWAFRATRKWLLVTLGLTAASWFIVGYWWGWGYCFCTDWHFAIRRARGFDEYDATYIQLLARVLIGQGMSDAFAQNLALATFIAMLICTAWANWPLRRRIATEPSTQSKIGKP